MLLSKLSSDTAQLTILRRMVKWIELISVWKPTSGVWLTLNLKIGLHGLPLAEYWYNYTYHTALQMSPFQALYGFPPPLISELEIPGPDSDEAQDFLSEKQ